jgi:hypothetical protein
MPYKPKKQRKKPLTAPEENLSSFNFGVVSPNSQDKDDTPLILHLQIPIVDENEPVIEDNIKHREHSLTEPFEYTPHLDIPHPYESHVSDSMPFTFENEYDTSLNDKQNLETSNPTNTLIENNSTSSKTVTTSLSENGICCWWCCHSYQTSTVSLPINKNDANDYTTVGRFCSPECAAAYNFESGHKYGDVWKQYTMLHNLVFSLLPQDTTMRIKLSPPREALGMFGGPYSILKYREFIKNSNMQLKMSVTPINPMFSITEETIPNNIYPSKTKKEDIPLDTNRVQKASTELRLKRMKRQTRENTLENFMQLKIGA